MQKEKSDGSIPSAVNKENKDERAASCLSLNFIVKIIKQETLFKRKLLLVSCWKLKLKKFWFYFCLTFEPLLIYQLPQNIQKPTFPLNMRPETRLMEGAALLSSAPLVSKGQTWDVQKSQPSSCKTCCRAWGCLLIKVKKDEGIDPNVQFRFTSFQNKLKQLPEDYKNKSFNLNRIKNKSSSFTGKHESSLFNSQTGRAERAAHIRTSSRFSPKTGHMTSRLWCQSARTRAHTHRHTHVNTQANNSISGFCPQ